MKERSKLHKESKPRVSHTIGKRLSTHLDRSEDHKGEVKDSDKRMKNNEGHMQSVPQQKKQQIPMDTK